MAVVEKNWIVNPCFFDELLNRFAPAIIHRDSDHLETARSVFFLQLDEPGYLSPARRTPGRPEVEHDTLVSKAGETHRIPIQIPQREIRCRVGMRWAESSHAGEKQQKHCEQDKKRSSSEKSGSCPAHLPRTPANDLRRCHCRLRVNRHPLHRAIPIQHRLAQRRVRVDREHQVVHRSFELHHRNRFGNQLRRLRPDDVHAQNLAVLRVGTPPSQIRRGCPQSSPSSCRQTETCPP